jgi:hypothetical protein
MLCFLCSSVCLFVPNYSVVLYSIPVVGCLPQDVFKIKKAVGCNVFLKYETIMKIMVDKIRYKLLFVLFAIF